MIIGLSFNFITVPEASKVTFIPSKSVNISFEISSDKSQVVLINSTFSNKSLSHIKKFDELSAKNYYVNNKAFTVNLEIPVKDAANCLIFSIKKSFVDSDVVFANLTIGNHVFSQKKISFNESANHDDIFFVSIDTTSFKDQIRYKDVKSNSFEKVFYLVVYTCQKYNKMLFILSVILMSIVVYVKRTNKFVLLFYLFCIFTTIVYTVLWKQSVFYFDSFFDGNYFPTIYKIAKTQYLPFIIFASVMLVSCVINNKLIRLVTLTLNFTFILLFISDVFTFTEFGCHIAISDVFTFGKDAQSSWGLISHFIGHNSFLTVACILLVAVYVYTSKLIYRSKKVSPFVLLLVLFMYVVYYCTPDAELSRNEDLFSNYLTTGAQTAKAEKQYSTKSSYKEPIISVEGLNKKRNVIVVFTESLSSNESKFFGGLYDKTPHLDEIASRYISFNNYYSNGFNTDTGNFAFFSSSIELHGIRSGLKDKMYILSDRFTGSILNFFKKEGYSTNCVYSADNIGELNKIWTKSGFDNFYDGNDPYYKNEERLTFNSVPDKAMFKRTLDLLPQWENKGNFFTFIMTTTTHGPYIVPNTREFDYHKTIQYFDESLWYFYQELLKQGFFKNGMLVITGDHKAMFAYSNEEMDKYGIKGIARVPLVIVTNDLPKGNYTYQLSHDSLGPLLEYINLKKAYHYQFAFLPFASGEPTDNNFILYQRHNPQDEVIVIDKLGKDHIVKLNGDDTNFDCSDVETSFRIKVLNAIKWLRQ